MRLDLLNCLAATIFAAGCAANPSLTNGELAGGADAYMSYYQPIGKLPVTISVKDGNVTMSVDPTVAIYPDINAPFRVHYAHAPLFDDNITIAINRSGLLAKISSSSSDQTTALATSVNGLLEQTAKAVKAIQELSPATGASDCAAASYKFLVRIEESSSRKYPEHVTGCELNLSADVRLKTILWAGASKAALGLVGDYSNMVSFRLTGAFEVTVRSEPNLQETIAVVAPIPDRLGYIKLDRKAFVDNSVTAEFTDGMLTSFSAQDPSQIIGILKLPVEVLKSVPILVAL